MHTYLLKELASMYSNDETNFPHKLLLTNTQGSKLRKAFANGLPANIKLAKA